MRFPLPPNALPPVQLTCADKEALEHTAHDLVQDMLLQYQEHLDTRKGVVDLTSWKMLKQRGNAALYQQRKFAMSCNGLQSDGSIAQRLPEVMMLGTMRGELDDVLYGAMSTTTDMMKIKTAYVHDDLVDCKVLDTIVTPTRADPLRSMVLKWSVKGRSLLARPIIRFRDSVYVEATGVELTSFGERIGYQLLHSVEVPQAHELLALNIVRARISICCLYHQKEPGLVEVYMKGVVDPLGDIRPSIAVASFADSFLSIWRNPQCALMKKLTWMISASTEVVAVGPNHLSESCSLCEKHLHGSFLRRRKLCRICHGPVCHRCRVSKTVNLLAPHTLEIVDCKVTFCKKCVFTATRTSSLTVATQELSCPQSYVAYHGGTISTLTSLLSLRSPSSSISISPSTARDRKLSDDSNLWSNVPSEFFSSNSSGQANAPSMHARFFFQPEVKTRPSWRC